MIDAHMVAMVKRYLAASAERSEAVDIASILWTIDAKEKAVPSREEINAALSEVPGLRVSCNGGKVFLSAVGEASELTSAHFNTAYTAYVQYANVQ